jgi:nitroimidazol reductase NimA-like FMN-containing flavoprotein (pyridoxamine 5'-phosphate oxidase superfamily)
MSAGPIIATESTTIHRLPERAASTWEAIAAILDEGFVCHVGFVGADGRPYVIPTAYGRIDDVLFLHGSPASRMLRKLAGGVDICVTVTLVDGFVLARSSFHHSLNYRSVVVLGHAVEEKDPEAKAAALNAFVDHVVPGRSTDAREPTPLEVRKTTVLRLPLREASAKVRTGPPVDDVEDLELAIWGGVVPLSLHAGAPEPDGLGPAGIRPPEYLRTNGPARPSRHAVVRRRVMRSPDAPPSV